MPISRNVILDLLPIYLAGEASDDTKTLVEEYLQSDKELAKMVTESNKTPFSGEVKMPISKETEMESLRKAQSLVVRTILITAGAVLFVCASLMVVTAVLVQWVYQ